VVATTAVVHDGAGASARGPVLGLDIGGTKLAAGVVDADGTVRGFVTAPSEPERGSDDALTRLFELGRRAMEDAGAPVEAVGIGCGGPLDPGSGVLIAPLHLTGWRDVPVVDLAQRAFDLPAVLDNDATAAAAAEHRFGAGRGTRNMVYLTVSTGVGGGVVIDGRVFRGATGNGGELGHVTVDWRGRVCRGCGRRGCLEAYVSGTSIAERAEEAGLRGATAADVADAARVGDPAAAKVWRETCDALACGIVSIANLFEPELVVVGGGVSRQGDHLLAPVRTAVFAQVIGPPGYVVRVEQAALGDTVGVAGAAAVAYERLAPEVTVATG
jgi:glucokinase